MNILILSWRGPGHPLAGGAEQVTYQHAKGWIKAGHMVTLFTSSFVGAKAKESINGVHIVRRGDQFFGVKIAAFFWYFFENKEKFDLIIDEFHGLPFFTPVWPTGAKKMALIHEVAQKVWGLNPWPPPFNRIAAILGKSGEPFMFKLLYRNTPFMTVSKSTKDDLRAWGVRKIAVVPNGVLLPKRLPRVSKEKFFTLIYLSAIAKDKGIEDALIAFNLVKKGIPNVQIWVLGKGYRSYLQFLHKLAPSAKFIGFVPDKKKFEMLARAHLLIFPSVHEGWGLVIMEAGSVGTPAIAYKVSGVKDAIVNGKTGLMADIQTTRSLAELILKLYRNKRLYFKLRHNVKKWSQKFTWQSSLRKSLYLLKTL